MKNWIFSAIGIALLSFLLQLILPWWIIAIPAFLVAFLLIDKPGRAFLAGMIAIAALWMIQAIITDASSSVSVAGVLGTLLGDISPILVYLITGLVGGLVAGFAAWGGTLSRGLLQRTRA